MFFTIGILMVVIGTIIFNVQNNELLRPYRCLSRWDYFAAALFWPGVLLVLYSLLALAWRYLP